MDGIGYGLIFIKAFQLKRRNENDREKEERTDKIFGKKLYIAVQARFENEPECESESSADYYRVGTGKEDFMFGDTHCYE
jgi:hypothetical protein